MKDNVINRYKRQISLKNIGSTGQKKLGFSSVMVIGAGGLGSSALYYLAAAGVGKLGVVDNDKVDMSNLNRQILFNESSFGKNKAGEAKERIAFLNSSINLKSYDNFADKNFLLEHINEYDFIIDATDNIKSKFLINDICVENSKPFCYAGVEGFTGQVFTYVPNHLCLRCVFGHNISNKKSNVSVIGFTPGIIGAIEAAESIKYLLKTGNLLTNKILTIDLLSMNFRKRDLSHLKKCSMCESFKQ